MKLYNTCLKVISSQCWLISGVEIWGGGGGGGPKAYILKSGGAVAPPAPLVPPPMVYNFVYVYQFSYFLRKMHNSTIFTCLAAPLIVYAYAWNQQ